MRGIATNCNMFTALAMSFGELDGDSRRLHAIVKYSLQMHGIKQLWACWYIHATRFTCMVYAAVMPLAPFPADRPQAHNT